MKKKIVNILLVILFLVGLSLLLYPSVSDYWNSFHQTRAIANYLDEVNQLDEEDYQELLDSAHAYNDEVSKKGNQFQMSDEDLAKYEQELDPIGTGMMGYVEIPSIECSLPIYHGTNDGVLQVAIGHIDWSSLPVGGESTHTVLSGHRGLPSAKLFTNLDKLEYGDQFLLQILNETLTYEVDQILIVEPNEVDSLQIEQGKDYCTLVTCTPYGVNSHRLLVRGHRVDTSLEDTVRIASEAYQIDPLLIAPIIAIIALILLVIIALVRPVKKNRKRNNAPSEER